MPVAKTNPAALSAEERRLRSRLHQLLGQAEGFLHGSLIEMARRCGNPRCRCASDEASKHRSLYLGQSRAGKTAMEYIPKDQEQTVRRWAKDYQQASTLLEALSQQGWRRLSQTKAKAKAAKKKGTSKKLAKVAKKATGKKAPRSKPRQSRTTRKPPSRSS